MIATAQALYSFLSGFGIPAYAENTIPKEAVLPYLTYPLKEPEWNTSTTFWIQVYYRHQTSNLDSLTKADEIVRSISDGVRIPVDGGWLVLWPETPLVQSMPPDGDVRAAYINLSLNAYKAYGT